MSLPSIYFVLVWPRMSSLNLHVLEELAVQIAARRLTKKMKEKGKHKEKEHDGSRVFSVVVGESMRERFLVFFHLFVFRETVYPRLEIDEEAEA